MLPNIGQRWPRKRPIKRPLDDEKKPALRAKTAKKTTEAVKESPQRPSRQAGAQEGPGQRRRQARCTAPPSPGPKPRSKKRSAVSRQARCPSPRASCITSIRSRCWSPWCCPRKPPTPASTSATLRLFALADTPEKMVALGEDRVPRAGQDHRAVIAPRPRTSSGCPEKLIAEHGGKVPGTREELREAARGRAQDRERRAQHGVRRADHGGRHAYLPHRQPHRLGARQGPAGGRAEAASR